MGRERAPTQTVERSVPSRTEREQRPSPRGYRTVPSAPHLPRIQRAQTVPGSAESVRDPQMRAFLEHGDAMLELRTNASWWMWDMFDVSLERCRALVTRSTVCWFRYRATVTDSRASLRADSTISCADADFASARPDALPPVPRGLWACIDSTLGDLEAVAVPTWAAADLDGYDGPLDLEVLVLPVTRAAGKLDGGL